MTATVVMAAAVVGVALCSLERWSRWWRRRGHWTPSTTRPRTTTLLVRDCLVNVTLCIVIFTYLCSLFYSSLSFSSSHHLSFAVFTSSHHLNVILTTLSISLALFTSSHLCPSPPSHLFLLITVSQSPSHAQSLSRSPVTNSHHLQVTLTICIITSTSFSPLSFSAAPALYPITIYLIFPFPSSLLPFFSTLLALISHSLPLRILMTISSSLFSFVRLPITTYITSF